VWGQERSSTSKWRRYGSRTDERTCTLLEIVGVLGEVEEIGIHVSPPPTHTEKKTGEWARKTRVSTRKQGYEQENIDKFLCMCTPAFFKVDLPSLLCSLTSLFSFC
jgi:hypothetical protein